MYQGIILRKWNFWSKIGLFLLLLILIIRSTPYLVPIRAQDIRQDERAIEFSDRNGLPLGTLLTQNQEQTAVIPLKEISPHFLHAIIAAEDKRFDRHGALDLVAIARSLWQSIQHHRIVSGASTITMQLARMLEPAPRTFSAKIAEIWLSWRLSAGMNREEILEAYINRLPMGSNIYGVEAASRIYFDTSASELNLDRATLLAAIPNNPNYLNPYQYWQFLKRRQKYVLDRMVEDGYISQQQAQRAIAAKTTLQTRQQGIIAAPHFLFWLAKQLPEKHSNRIRTTIDRSLQQFVETQVKQIVQNLAPQNVHHAAALIIDNQTGEVLAYVGSPDYFLFDRLGSNDGVQALRQPGSTLKPFLYQQALEKRLIRPNTILADVPTHYAIPGGKLYSPTDYNETYSGPVLIRFALANSLNIPAIRILEKVGVANFLNRLQELGFEHLNKQPEYYGLGLTLGSGEVSLWELARAYVTMARQGNSIPIVTRSQARSIASLHKPSANKQSWSIVTNILSDRYARAKSFGVDSVLNLPFATAVKTGTSSNFRDTWTVGFSHDYTVATWVGNFQGEPMRKVSGVMGAAPLWARIMLHLHEHHEPQPLPQPNLVKRPVCALSGMKPVSVCPTVVQEYFYPEDLPEYENRVDTVYETVGVDRSKINLPPQYDRWLAKQPQLISRAGSLKIVSPNHGDKFIFYPNSGEQKLEFKVTEETNESVEWWLNDRKIATNKSSSLFWQLSPGSWSLEVRKGKQRDRLKFQVELAQPRVTRRGFSVIP
ncbi:MAG: penicillin-binding protein 1C [Xenococcaceae cyanobacterium]